jgi:hypothetical protein
MVACCLLGRDQTIRSNILVAFGAERRSDEGRISNTPVIAPLPYILKFESFCVEVAPKDEVKPNFITPSMLFRFGPKGMIKV